ncbi:MAG: GAF domain-containing protein [Acidobacteria bacterium]|nr:GAF domain-containing protein [Acidobacteriota bacterium]
MTDSNLSFPDPPRIELDRRLSDLVDAANQVLATQGRLRALLRANHAISAQLDLDSVLRSIVASAQELTGAQFAALGVLDEHGGLEQFIHTGMDPEDVARIGRLPQGEGLLGALIRDPTPIRITDIASDRRAAGFPDGHPPMRDFLGVPVRIRDAVYGNLYLANSPAGAFTEEDEQLVRSLAATAGFAVENARLYRETQRRQQWAVASAEITAQLLGPEPVDALSLVAGKVLVAAGAMSVFVVFQADEADRLTVVDVQGADPHLARATTVTTAETIADATLRTGDARRFDEHEIRALGKPHLEAFGPVMVLPLTTPDRTLGALVVARAQGGVAFSDMDVLAATDFAGRAGVAIELAAARRQTEQVLLFEDRGRIARDLHDRVIQQLFATGMQLQGVLGTLPPGRSADRVDAAVTSLDDSIAQIRRIIFTLESTARGPERSTGRQRLFDLIEQLSTALSIDPQVNVSGPVDAVLDGDLAEDVLAVVREGVSNAVKHAAGGVIDLTVTADARGIAVVVRNSGSLPADSGRRSGLRNLEERARRRHGGMTLGAEGDSTVLRWNVPLRHLVEAVVQA